MGNGTEDSIEGNTPWGHITVHGKTVILVIGMIAIIALQLYIERIRQIDREVDRKKQSDEHKELTTAMKVNNYLISLPIEDRPKLIMPVELWGMIEPDQPVQNPIKGMPFILKRKSKTD